MTCNQPARPVTAGPRMQGFQAPCWEPCPVVAFSVSFPCSSLPLLVRCLPRHSLELHASSRPCHPDLQESAQGPRTHEGLSRGGGGLLAQGNGVRRVAA